MFKIVRDFIEFRKQREQRKINVKRFVISKAVEKYYMDLQLSTGNVDLPPFMLTYKAMQGLKSNKDVNRLYTKLEMAGLI